MTVEAMIFIALGLLAVGLILKKACRRSSTRKVDRGGKTRSEVVPALSSANSQMQKAPGAPPDLMQRDAAPTAEMQAIGDSHAMAMAQILVSKGQVIEAVKVLHENAGYDMEKAVAAVDSMGKKVYTAD
jgi:hypothetical protein